MNNKWDYTNVANSYNSRPDYSEEAIKLLISSNPKKICDIGAGTGKLTHKLTPYATVVAVEPNEKMRLIGQMTPGAEWVVGTGESTGLTPFFDLVTFGSSFNVCDRILALNESYRLLLPNGYFACLWNHRDLNDPLQKEIEQIIQYYLPDYNYGVRREDQTDIISTVFSSTEKYIFPFVSYLATESVKKAWLSHVTLQQHAGEKFTEICEIIFDKLPFPMVTVPYNTVMWRAKK